MKRLFNLLLSGSILLLGYLCVMSILDPIRFADEKKVRDRAVIRRLVDIRKAQVEYRNLYGRYVASFDTLIDFIKNGRISFVYKEGTLSDQQLENGLSEEKATEIVRRGRMREIEAAGLLGFRRDTMYVNVCDTLYGKGYPVDSIRYVPGTRTSFEMAVGEMMTASGFTIQLFEAKTPYEVYLHGLDEREILRLRDKAEKLDRYPGLQVGSVDEANNNAGNWE